MKPADRRVLLVWVALLAACTGDASEGPQKAFEVRDGGGLRDAGTAQDPDDELDLCAAAPTGTSCGNRKHCIAGRCVPNICGDGVKAGREECDDANDATGDGCDPQCLGEPDACGNGRLDADEACDDGNAIDDDGCSDLCTINERCGDGRVAEGEECDDGNAIDDDACTNACEAVQCGNGRRDPGEQCDGDDQCSETCRSLLCGNGVRDGEEECDDGNTTTGDGCADDCTTIECGNARVEPPEECDDGNTEAGDGCGADCRQEACGNRRVEAGEECDGEPYCTDECVRGSEDLCRDCEEMHCRNYLDFGWDLLAGCYDGTPPEDVATEPAAPPDEYAAACVAATDCVRRNGCGAGENGAAACYCGSASIDECVADGPAPDAPCLQEFLRAALTTNRDLAFERTTDWHYPAGNATFLIECDRASCKAECLVPAP